MTQMGKRQTVDIHNELRTREGAADMELMTWNNLLASSASKWAANCAWGHGMMTAKPDYNSTGQNCLAAGGKTINVTNGIRAFYSERCNFNVNRMKCLAGRVCGLATFVQLATVVAVCGTR